MSSSWADPSTRRRVNRAASWTAGPYSRTRWSHAPASPRMHRSMSWRSSIVNPVNSTGAESARVNESWRRSESRLNRLAGEQSLPDRSADRAIRIAQPPDLEHDQVAEGEDLQQDQEDEGDPRR